jgi:hypothetical protein
VRYGQAFAAGVDGPVARVTLLRTGSVTHNLDAENRFLELGFVQTGGQLAVTPPAGPNLAPAGYSMLFALDAAGVSRPWRGSCGSAAERPRATGGACGPGGGADTAPHTIWE